MADTPGDAATLYDERSLNDVEAQRRKDTHNDSDVDQGSVDVARAERQFEELSRQLSSRSANKKQGDDGQIHIETKDLEKAASSSTESLFDLREYLTSSNDANQQAGIKHKVSILKSLLLHIAYFYVSSTLVLRGKGFRSM